MMVFDYYKSVVAGHDAVCICAFAGVMAAAAVCCAHQPSPVEASAPLTDDQKIWVVECVSRTVAESPQHAVHWCTRAAHKLTARGML